MKNQTATKNQTLKQSQKIQTTKNRSAPKPAAIFPNQKLEVVGAIRDVVAPYNDSDSSTASGDAADGTSFNSNHAMKR